MFNQNDYYVMNQNKVLNTIGESLKIIGLQLQTLAPPGVTPGPPESQTQTRLTGPLGMRYHVARSLITAQTACTCHCHRKEKMRQWQRQR